MRKYIEMTKTSLKLQIAWRADIFFEVLFSVVKILFAYLLWGTIFGGKSEIGGFSLAAMMSYYIINSFLGQLDRSAQISEEINQMIRNGTFSKYVVLPINIQGYFMTKGLGGIIYYLGLDLLVSIIWVFVFQIDFFIIHQVSLIVSAISMSLLGLFFMMQLNYYLGILTLKYEEISTFLLIKNNLLSLISGSIIPLILFPEVIVRLMSYLPFYYITYLPSMILLGRCSNEALKGLIVIGGWCVVMQIIIIVTWKKFFRKYDGVGI